MPQSFGKKQIGKAWIKKRLEIPQAQPEVIIAPSKKIFPQSLLVINSHNFFYVSKSSYLKCSYSRYFRVYRYIAYRRFVRWIYHWLGKRNHKVLPSCIINAIIDQFPSFGCQYVFQTEVLNAATPTAYLHCNRTSSIFLI
jgi:hypothetical protein